MEVVLPLRGWDFVVARLEDLVRDLEDLGARGSGA